jgi:hypothetical protein
MPANIFSPIIHGDINNGRRVLHSATNYFSSIDRSSFGFSNAGTQVVNAASTFAGTAGGVAGGIALGMSATAATAVVGAGFLAAVAGPQVAVTAAVVGLALLVKGTYSNREAAHKSLTKYVWNLVDDVPPAEGVNFTAKGLEDAADAATTLLDDGKNQIKLLGTKLQASQAKFAALNTRIQDLMTTFIAEQNKLNAMITGRRGPLIKAQREKLQELRTALENVWAKESKPGGAIFEYVRRCSHTGNYLQAPHIVALAMKEKHSPGSVVGTPQLDYFQGSTLATNSRSAFTTLEQEYAKRLPVP